MPGQKDKLFAKIYVGEFFSEKLALDSRIVENGETRLISLEDNINLVDNILTVTPRIIDKVQKILKHDKNNDKDVKFQEDIDKKKKE